MNIRPLTPDELPSLMALYKHLHSADDPLPPALEVEAVWSEIVASERLMIFGVFLDVTLVSSCALAVVPNLTRGCRPYGLIENVVTHPSFRRQGYGAATLRAALAYAWNAGCYKVMLLTGRKDEAITRFYESVGFESGSKQAFIAKPPTP